MPPFELYLAGGAVYCPVLVVHAGALKAFGTNEFNKEKFKTDNPNLKALEELKK